MVFDTGSDAPDTDLGGYSAYRKLDTEYPAGFSDQIFFFYIYIFGVSFIKCTIFRKWSG
jgi:hypothetical protein